MSHHELKCEIEIAAPASKIWQVFVNPALTRHLGGEYVTEWRPGAFIGWKNLDNEMVTKGEIVDIAPEALLKHKLLNPIGDVDSVITYELVGQNGTTTLRAREQFSEPISDSSFADSLEEWDAALQAVKKLAERA